ncbi:hypothetical protein Tco_1383275 [Tanacetum coccineum]
MHSRGPEILKVELLGDDPLIKFGFNILERLTHADIPNSSNLVAAKNELMRTIAEKEELLNNYRVMKKLEYVLVFISYSYVREEVLVIDV